MQESIAFDDPTRRCGTCGKEFTPKKSNQRYCEPDHRPKPMTIKVSPEQRLAILAIAQQLR